MPEIIYEEKGTTGVITLNRPEVRNALTFGMYEEIARICQEIQIDGSVRAVVMTGAGGKAFAAGTDMAQFRDFSEPQDAIDYEARIERVLDAIERCPVPTIAAITGACTGGGAAIAAACDIRIGDQRQRFGFPISRTLGNCLSTANLQRLSTIVGSARVREIILKARLVDADEALSCGWLSEVLDTPDAVQARALELAETLSGHAPLTMRATKEGLRRLRTKGGDAKGTDLVVECYMSEDFKEGIEAFLGKRKPDWKAK